jgi:hypothetical protein
MGKDGKKKGVTYTRPRLRTPPRAVFVRRFIFSFQRKERGKTANTTSATQKNTILIRCGGSRLRG